ncbi:rhomboid family intramembrane serine protease [Enemella sp. A6]|uniref:rhomboid family intramembrane serine protease n=1 Tax=Enemella sp. A6 TaxID=3440152 RepID=UPI003EBCAAD1
MSDQPGPDFNEPGFAPCYRHADRSTGINCQRCSRPICGECMVPASVGFQCPDCVGRARAQNRAAGPRPVTRLARGGRTITKSATLVIIAIVVALQLINLFTRDMATQLTAWFTPLVEMGQYWRILTYLVSPAGLLGTLITGLVMYFIGRFVEEMLGTARFVAVFLIIGLGGAAAMSLASLAGIVMAAASGTVSVIGLFATNAMVKRNQGMDIRPDLILLGILLAFSLVTGGFTFIGQIGAIAGGAAAGAVLTRRGLHRTQRRNGLIAIAAALLVLIAVGIIF